MFSILIITFQFHGYVLISDEFWHLGNKKRQDPKFDEKSQDIGGKGKRWRHCRRQITLDSCFTQAPCINQ